LPMERVVDERRKLGLRLERGRPERVKMSSK
jgi:hypothetical protein